MKIPSLLTLFVLLSAAAPFLAAAEKVHSIKFKGMERIFRVFVPEATAVAGPPPPVVLALHGGASDGEMMARFSGLNEKAAKAGFIVVYPDGSGRLPRVLTWNSGACCGYARPWGSTTSASSARSSPSSSRRATGTRPAFMRPAFRTAP